MSSPTGRGASRSFYVRLRLPENLGGEARDAFSAIVPRIAGKFSFQGLEDWAVDVKNSRVLGAEAEFQDLTREGLRNSEMRVYFARLSDAQKFGKFLGTVFADVKISPARALAAKDWMKLWRKHYKTQTLREGKRRLAIVPAWKKVPAGIPSLRITPGQAFGTGTHPTTQLCLRLFLKYGADALKVLDFGAGTGVLAIAAFKAGGAKTVAVESDRVALEQCRKNARLNRVKGMKFSRTIPKGRFDLVFANVLAPVLLDHRNKLHGAVAKGGMIFLSGLLASEAAGFLKKFTSRDFRTFAILEQGDWSAIALRRNS